LVRSIVVVLFLPCEDREKLDNWTVGSWTKYSLRNLTETLRRFAGEPFMLFREETQRSSKHREDKSLQL
jgi:hypothetical protein